MVVWACNDLERERNVREGRIVWQGDLLARKVGRECGIGRGFDLSLDHCRGRFILPRDRTCERGGRTRPYKLFRGGKDNAESHRRGSDLLEEETVQLIWDVFTGFCSVFSEIQYQETQREMPWRDPLLQASRNFEARAASTTGLLGWPNCPSSSPPSRISAFSFSVIVSAPPLLAMKASNSWPLPAVHF